MKILEERDDKDMERRDSQGKLRKLQTWDRKTNKYKVLYDLNPLFTDLLVQCQYSMMLVCGTIWRNWCVKIPSNIFIYYVSDRGAKKHWATSYL